MKKNYLQYLGDLRLKVVRTQSNFELGKALRIDRSIKREQMEKAINYLFAASYDIVDNLDAVAYTTSEPTSFENRTEGKKLDIKLNDLWSQDVFDCAWFHFKKAITQTEDTVLLLNLGGEGLVFDKYGNPKQSITCSASQYDFSLGLPVKQVVEVDGLVEDGILEFWVDAAANDLFGKYKNKAMPSKMFVAKRNKHIRELAYDLSVLISAYDYNPINPFTINLYATVRNALKNYKNITDEKAKELLKLTKPLLSQTNDGESFEYFAVGHAHLDLAWLWPIRESKRKGGRTFATQLLNLEKYPDYIFGASQAQLYDWVKKDYPAIYEKMTKYIEEGRWDVQGATWVEMDSNLIGGESLIRQFYYGKNYLNKEFNQDMKILWLPDSFGYSACIPQVMKLANVPYFLTQKMSWNTVTKFPHHTFNWQGLDGSTVFAHMLPENTYNGPCRADIMKRGEKNYQERKISNKSMMLFGIGDGGAGPGAEHLERMQRVRDLNGLPKVTPKKSLDFFEILDDKKIDYPTYIGELYLEKHQGTYTTQSKNKLYNRQCEFLLKNYEYLMACATKINIKLPIDSDELDEIWKEILLYQFHDIIPGSSINRVYTESVDRYEILMEQLNQAIAKLIDNLYDNDIAINFNSFPVNKIISHKDEEYLVEIPPYGTQKLNSSNVVTFSQHLISKNTIENEYATIKFANGYITSYYDKKIGKELVAKNAIFGQFSSYIDLGDCWDIRPRNYKCTKSNFVCVGFKLGETLASSYAQAIFKNKGTTITATYTLLDNQGLLKIDLDIDCHQKSKMLRMKFPLSVVTKECKFNIQFGHISRRTTENTKEEKAQFEVSGQKFVDMSNDEFGVSLLNDCKYGYRTKGNVIDVDLIRSPKMGPGKMVDQGKHKIQFAIFSHQGTLSSDTYSEAYYLNNPVITTSNTNAINTSNIEFSTTNKSLVIEHIAISKDKNSLVARVYNCSEVSQTGGVLASGYTPISTVDIFENKLNDIEKGLTFRPFELKLIKLEAK